MRAAGAALHEVSLTTFAEAVASMSPLPGGSCAAPVPGAVAAGLAAMVARQTAACAPFTDLAWDMDAVAVEADHLRVELLDLIDDDARAFDRVMAARRMPEETPAGQAARLRRIQAAYRAAVDPPMRVCTRSLRLLELILDVAERGNPNASCDAGVAVLLATAALECAALNVENDLRPIDDEVFRSSCAEQVHAARERARTLRESALAPVLATLSPTP